MINPFKLIYYGMKKVGETIMHIVNFLLLAVVYFVSLGLVSVIGKALKKTFMSLRLRRSGSYWDEHETNDNNFRMY